MKLTEKEKDVFAAQSVLSLMNNVKSPTLIFDYEKDIVKRALAAYLNELKKAE